MGRIKENYYVVDFEHIDDFRCFHPLQDAIEPAPLSDPTPAEREQRLEALRNELGELFSAAGWEGDGTINCFFVPPCFCNRGDTYCETIYHVKQDNNGTSWLAIPRGFSFGMPQAQLSKVR